MSETMKNIFNVVLVIVAIIGLYLVGLALDQNLVVMLAPELAAAAVAWVVHLINKWAGLKVDFLDSEFTKQKVSEAILWAEEQARLKLKLDGVVITGTEKLKLASAKLFEKYGISQGDAVSLIDDYFGQVRPLTEELWRQAAESVPKKIPKPKKK